MDLKYELLANSINTIVRSKIEKAFDDVKTETEAISYVMLFEIKQIILCKEMSDSDKLKEILKIYDKNNVDFDIHTVDEI
ncbi:MAG: hypothetical protein IKV86_01320 [Clostridia bacterium]|nr:hypothetical protein [Clostridia bacterium]